MRGQCQHAQQRDCGKSDFLEHLFHPSAMELEGKPSL
jgi:hypothetical protein